MSDLLASLEPPREDLDRPVGTIRGPSPRWAEGFGAGLAVWCGPTIGWRDFGDVVLGDGRATVVRALRAGAARPRLLVGLSFDLGEAPPLRRQADQDEHP